jgi:hypothetical protein
MTRYKTLFDKTKQQWCEIKGKELRYTEAPVLKLYSTDFPYEGLPRYIKEYIVVHCEVKYLNMYVITSTSPTVWKSSSSYTREQIDLVKSCLAEGINWRAIHKKYFIERSPRAIQELIKRIK